MTAGETQKPRRIDQLPETLEGMPETSTQEVKPESNPFTSRDWRMLLYAWAGLGVRILLVVGAAFLTASDILGRVVARPGEIQVGIVTAILGAPFLIFLARQRTVAN